MRYQTKGTAVLDSDTCQEFVVFSETTDDGLPEAELLVRAESAVRKKLGAVQELIIKEFGRAAADPELVVLLGGRYSKRWERPGKEQWRRVR